MKLFAATIALVLSLSAVSNGASIVWAAQEDNGFSLANGSNLPAGNFVRVGTFDISDSAIAAAALTGDVAFLNSHFTEFDNARIGDGLNGIDEHFIADSGEFTAGPLVGAQIYLWALASNDTTSIATSLSTAFQLGIFYFDKAQNSEWALPNDDIGSAVGIELTNLSNGNALATGAHVVVGTFPTGTSDLPGNAPNFGLSIVPEPSVATAVIASVGLLALRRRRRS